MLTFETLGCTSRACSAHRITSTTIAASTTAITIIFSTINTSSKWTRGGQRHSAVLTISA